MSRPGKIPSQTRFEPRIFRSRGGRFQHQANEEALKTGKVNRPDEENGLTKRKDKGRAKRTETRKLIEKREGKGEERDIYIYNRERERERGRGREREERRERERERERERV